MLTADAMNGFKDHVKKTVSHAMYKINSSFAQSSLQNHTTQQFYIIAYPYLVCQHRFLVLQHNFLINNPIYRTLLCGNAFNNTA